MTLSDSIKGLVLALIVMSMFLYGYNYYRYSQTDPDFCSSCHQLKGAHADWLKSRHHDSLCQQCHQLGNVEQNLRLVSYVLTGKNPIGITHGRSRPWEECASCHMEQLAQGSYSPNKSYGHARHGDAQHLSCRECHSGKGHNFPASDVSCQKCHEGKSVHGLETAEFSCLKCHIFSQKSVEKFDRGRCVKCHKNVPAQGAMASLSCHYCHKPHKTEKPQPKTCTAECHKSESSFGQHGVHAKAGMGCMQCHRPHVWKSSPEEKRRLCGQCHTYKDPAVFKYNL